MTDFRFEVFLGRIEVIAGKNPRGADDNIWRVTLDRLKPEVAVATGMFRTTCKDGTGRILAYGIITMREKGGVLPSLEELRHSSMFPDCVEAIYDTARRSLNAQAALMDFSFDLPVQAPEAEIKIKKRPLNGMSKPELAETK